MHALTTSRLAAIFLFSVTTLLAESAKYQIHEKRLAELVSRQQKVCEQCSAEGQYFMCYQKLLRDLEIELESLTRDVQSELPEEQKASFQRSAQAWASYLALEKKHWDSMKRLQGSVRNIGQLTHIVELVKVRCNLVLWQLD